MQKSDPIPAGKHIMQSVDIEITKHTVPLNVNGRLSNLELRSAHLPARRAARTSAPDRYQERLRSRPVRRVHRADQRPADQFLPHAGGHARRTTRSSPSKAWARPTRCTPCRRRFSSTTASNAATARPVRSARRSACSAKSKAGWPSHVTADVASPQVELTDAEIRERMSGNICRCAAYPNIVAAIRDVAEGVRE